MPLGAQYYIILVGQCRFRYIFSRCIYCDNVPPDLFPFSFHLDISVQSIFIVSFCRHSPIYLPAIFIYLHTRMDCDHCRVVAINIRSSDRFISDIVYLLTYTDVYSTNFALRQTEEVQIGVVSCTHDDWFQSQPFRSVLRYDGIENTWLTW